MRCACKKEIVDGERAVTVSVAINWGDDDARADWEGVKLFCSFGCLHDWVGEMREKHDGRKV